jgi:hypothetical protein
MSNNCLNAKGAVMRFSDILNNIFPCAYKESDFVKRTFGALNKLGFNADNTIACVGICRDEICQSLFEGVRRNWGPAFNLSSLGGMFFAGRTGLIAAMHHAPNVDGRERYVFYSLPHIAINKEGRIGICKRRGRKGESIACGALDVFQKEISVSDSEQCQQKTLPSLTLNTDTDTNKLTPTPITDTLDSDDIELSLIRMRLIKEIPSGHIPDLFELTKITQKVIQKDLENTLKAIIPPHPPLEKGGVGGFECDYSIITGIQIHGPDNNYIWPASCYAVVKGIRQDIGL